MPTRAQELSRVRELLGFPKEQRPGNHSLLSGLIRQEQLQNNRLGNTGLPWTQATTTVTTVANQAEYTLTPAKFGKVLQVYRELDNNQILPVPFTDYINEFSDQKYEFWLTPFESGLNPNYSGEKCAFFRTDAGANKMRIFPVPETAAIVYTIIYATGWLDWSGFALSDTPILPEWSDHRCIKTALFYLPLSEWDGLTMAENSEKRKELALSLQMQYAEQEEQFDLFVRNPQIEPVSEVGFWYE